MKWIKRDNRLNKLPDGEFRFLARIVYALKRRPDYRILFYEEGAWYDDWNGEPIDPQEITHWMAIDDPED